MTSKTTNKFVPEVRKWAVRMVLITSVITFPDGRPWYRLPRRSAAFRRRCMSG
jgi:hypothetical protein